MPKHSGPNGKVPVTDVYVVCDHPITCAGLVDLIDAQPDMRVVGRADGIRAASAATADEPPDVVVVDMEIDGGEGLALAQELRERAAAPAVLLYSMQDEKIFARRAMSLGVSGFVSKCATAEDVVDAIRRVAGGGMYVSRAVTEHLLLLATGHREPDRFPLPVHTLSKREREVFESLGHGMSTAEIAEHMSVKQKTVETYREKIKRKLGLSNSHQLIQRAVQWHLFSQDELPGARNAVLRTFGASRPVPATR